LKFSCRAKSILDIRAVKDFGVALFLLNELEGTRTGLTSDELHARLGSAGFNPPDKRTVQRLLEEYRKRKIIFEKSGRRYSLLSAGSNISSLLNFLRDLLLDKDYASIFYGDIEVRRGRAYFSDRSDLVNLFYLLIRAIRESKVITFNYTPRTYDTLRDMEAPSEPQKPRSVRLLPRYIIASGNSFLALGESYEKQSFYKNHYGKPVCRQYELRGVANLKLTEACAPKLSIDPHDLYRNSVHIWVGGDEYEIEVEELWLGDNKVRRKKLKINGEDEILSLVAASLGKMRILNPPKALVERANQIGLPYDLTFRFEE